MEIKNSADLSAAILELKQRNLREKQQLVENFHEFSESIRPINLIKSTIGKVKNDPGITGMVVKAAVGLGVGILSKRLLIGKTHGIIGNIIGSAVKMGLAGIVANKSDTIKNTGIRILKNLFRSKKKEAVF